MSEYQAIRKINAHKAHATMEKQKRERAEAELVRVREDFAKLASFVERLAA